MRFFYLDMSEFSSEAVKRFLVGKWKTESQVYAAAAGLVLAIQKGLGPERAIEIAVEAAADPVRVAVSDEKSLEWLEENYARQLPRQWAVQVERRWDHSWTLSIELREVVG